jgi:RHS repeat-associated protein
MKAQYIKCFLLVLAIIAEMGTNLYSQSTNQNYVRTRTYTNDVNTSYLDAIQYYDGLGRPNQTVQKGVTPTGKDLIILQEYDAFGRDDKAWLPAAISGNNGAYVTPVVIKTNDQKSYSYPLYEASPLNRVTHQYGPGADWQANGKAVRVEYLANKKSEPVLRCRTFGEEGRYITPEGGIFYLWDNRYESTEDGRFQVVKTTDEDGNESYEFKNKLGQVVLARQVNSGLFYDTYFHYNEYNGKISYVLPPEASSMMQGSIADTQGMLDYIYIYEYDDFNRCIAKKLPGCHWIYYIYDKADRVIFTQNGELRAKGEWMFTIPDAFGSIVLTGTCKNNITFTPFFATKSPLKDIIVKATWTGSTNTTKGYMVSGITLADPTILSVNYYDNYDFRGATATGIPSAGTEYNTEAGYGAQYTGGYKGLLTGTLTAQMNYDGTTDSTYLYSVMYYDSRGRLIQTKGSNHLTGGIEKKYITYNFTGQPIQRKHIHSATGKNTQTEVYAYTYDHAGRLLTTTHQLTDGTTVKPQVTLAENSYDDLGRLKTNKKRGVAGTLATYTYNVRSWTKSITSPLFTETLYYNESYGGSVKQYNGNISAMSWKQLTEPLRYYAYSYDNLSRLTNANYGEDNSATNRFTTSYSYDKHSNMKTLTRRGNTDGSATNGMVDNLTMTYNGNQLAKVSDTGVNVPISSSMDFKDYSNVATEYTYNANGAMNKDLNKGISDIQYNSLNLPRMMDIKSSVAEARNEYTYSASGQKLKVVQKWNPNFSTAPVIGSGINTASLTQARTTDYTGNIIYENNALKRILVNGGYYEGGVYYYYLADHLGNNHVVVKSDGTSIQSNSYYPFGMHYAPGIGYEKQPYKYNNKELDQMHGLNMYDNLARLYDPVVPHTPTPDPHAENYYSWSPYHYAANNPLLITDPTGMDWYRNEDGTAYIWREGSAQTYTHTIGEGDNAISMTMSRVGETYVQMLSDGTKMVWNQQNLESMTEPQSFEQGTMSFMENWSSSNNFFASLGYNILNDAYVAIQPLTFGLIGETTNEFTGGIAHTNLDGTTNYKGINSATSTAALLFGGSAASSSTKAATGGIKQWIRIGSSYSHNLGSKTALSIRWGASPKYANKIGNTILRDLNQSIRQSKLPGDSWRVKDAGHLHIMK